MFVGALLIHRATKLNSAIGAEGQHIGLVVFMVAMVIITPLVAGSGGVKKQNKMKYFLYVVCNIYKSFRAKTGGWRQSLLISVDQFPFPVISSSKRVTDIFKCVLRCYFRAPLSCLCQVKWSISFIIIFNSLATAVSSPYFTAASQAALILFIFGTVMCCMCLLPFDTQLLKKLESSVCKHTVARAHQRLRLLKNGYTRCRGSEIKRIIR